MEKQDLRSTPDERPSHLAENDKDVVVLIIRHRSMRRRGLAIGFTAIAFLYLCFSISRPLLSHPRTPVFEAQTEAWEGPARTGEYLVPLEAHIMSKCPDAKTCLRDMVLPTMQRVSAKVNFTLSYIGTPTANDGVACKHGAGECLGNIIELCAAYLYPEPRIYLGFVMCLTRDYSYIPEEELVKDCALEHGINFDKLNACSSSDDGFGIEMLRKSVTRSKDVGASISCTVRLNDETYCIHDDGKWKNCPTGPGFNDLVIAIEKLYNSSF